jgi:hypothetical protein
VRLVFWLVHRENRGWIPGKTDGFVSSVKLRTGFGGPPSLLFVGYREPFAGVKLPRHEVIYASTSSVEFKKTWSCTSTAPYALKHNIALPVVFYNKTMKINDIKQFYIINVINHVRRGKGEKVNLSLAVHEGIGGAEV